MTIKRLNSCGHAALVNIAELPLHMCRYLEGLAQVREQGLADAVGVSNFNAERTRKAAHFLEVRLVFLSVCQCKAARFLDACLSGKERPREKSPFALGFADARLFPGGAACALLICSAPASLLVSLSRTGLLYGAIVAVLSFLRPIRIAESASASQLHSSRRYKSST